MTPSPRRAAGVLAVLFAVLHAPFLPTALEDVDSFNFALGVREFDVAQHQPHPPGYPVYILAGKLAHLIWANDATALAALATLAGALGVLGLTVFYQRLDPEPYADRLSVLAATLAATAPLYWFTAARPLSDMAGLAAIVALQAWTLGAKTPRDLGRAAFAAGIAAGIRSQVVWLTLPLMAIASLRQPKPDRLAAAWRIALGVVAGGLVWFIPLVIASGGLGAYWRALADQGAEDLTGVVMLWTTPTPRVLVNGVYTALIAPWAAPGVAAVVLAFATIGTAELLWNRPKAVITLAVAYVPYAVFNLLFQETVTTRYALPLVVPVAYLAVRGVYQGAVLMGRLTGAVVPPVWNTALIAVLAAANLLVAVPAVRAYAAAPPPTMTMLTEMQLAERSGRSPVLAMHRRAEFDLRRPFFWLGRDAPQFTTRLPSPPRREWLELVKYWNGGGTADVWFVADPLRSDLALVGHPRLRERYRWNRPDSPWPFDLFALLGGVRPSEFDWQVIPPPAWYVGEGWALTPETAGLARQSGVEPGRVPITGWIRRRPEALTMMIGGRNFSTDGSQARIRLAIDDQPFSELVVPPGFFLEMIDVPAGRLVGDGPYAALRVAAEPAASSGIADVGIEQFDVGGVESPVSGFGTGWYEEEYIPATGEIWRWSSERAQVVVRGADGPLRLQLDGEIEEADESRVTIRAGDRVLAEETVGQRFMLIVPVPADAILPGADIIIESSHTYVPAERRWRSPDLRRLGLKISRFALTPAS